MFSVHNINTSVSWNKQSSQKWYKRVFQPKITTHPHPLFLFTPPQFVVSEIPQTFLEIHWFQLLWEQWISTSNQKFLFFCIVHCFYTNIYVYVTICRCVLQLENKTQGNFMKFYMYWVALMTICKELFLDKIMCGQLQEAYII